VGESKTLKNKLVAAYIAILLTFFVFGQGVFSCLVLCIGSSNHPVLVPFHTNLFDAGTKPKQEQANHRVFTKITVIGNACRPCIDIPLSSFFSFQNTSPIRHFAFSAKTLKDNYSSSATVVPLSIQTFYDTLVQKISVLIDPTGASLQKTVLLI
jgi:hypothetical protein